LQPSFYGVSINSLGEKKEKKKKKKGTEEKRWKQKQIPTLYEWGKKEEGRKGDADPTSEAKEGGKKKEGEKKWRPRRNPHSTDKKGKGGKGEKGGK